MPDRKFVSMDRPTRDISLWTTNSPVTDGRLQDFVVDPIACMRRLFRQHGDLAVLHKPSSSWCLSLAPS